MERSVTIPLNEYDDLKKEIESYKEAFDNGHFILTSSYTGGISILKVTDAIKNIERENNALRKENNDLSSLFYHIKKELFPEAKRLKGFDSIEVLNKIKELNTPTDELERSVFDIIFNRYTVK